MIKNFKNHKKSDFNNDKIWTLDNVSDNNDNKCNEFEL